eukprot:scaffold216075_cov35-Attheya_sp.AAC.1
MVSRLQVVAMLRLISVAAIMWLVVVFPSCDAIDSNSNHAAFVPSLVSRHAHPRNGKYLSVLDDTCD